MTAGVTLSGRTRCSITDMSGRTKTPPLKAAIGVLSPSGSISIDMPRGGRPLVIAKSIPACFSFPAAAMARSVRTLSWVTSVPSTSARSIRIAMLPPGPVRASGRRAVGHHQRRRGFDAARRDRGVASQEPGQGLLLVAPGDQRGGVPVRAKAQVNEIELPGQRIRVGGRRGLEIALIDRHGPHLRRRRTQ